MKEGRSAPRPKPEKPWVPLERGVLKPKDAIVMGAREVWLNDHYQVWVDIIPPEADRGDQPMVHLSIKRLDREPLHDWRDLQRIKNELLGTTTEAAELYPAEERLVDGANQYHLWGLPPGRRFPFGFQERATTDSTKDSQEVLAAAARAAGMDPIPNPTLLKQRDRAPHHTAIGCPVDGKLGMWWESKGD